MALILLDTCVILDILDKASHWHTWAKETLRELTKTYDAVINPIIFSELCAGMESPAAVLKLLNRLNIGEQPLNHDTLFLAAKAFLKYRKQGGKKNRGATGFLYWSTGSRVQMAVNQPGQGALHQLFPND